MYNPVEMQGRFFVLNSFFRSYHLINSLDFLCEEYDKEQSELSPWTHIHNVLLSDAVISWSKLFGMDSEECHWKNLVNNQDNFKKELFEKLGISPKEFRKYQLKVLDFRNKWVVHYEPSYKHDIIPYFEHMHASALALHNYLRIQVGENYGGPECMESFGKEVAESFIGNLQGIKR
jgi:hypothetical protein